MKKIRLNITRGDIKIVVVRDPDGKAVAYISAIGDSGTNTGGSLMVSSWADDYTVEEGTL